MPDRAVLGPAAGALVLRTETRQHLDPVALRVVDQCVRRVEAHRLLVQQATEELRPVVDPQPGRLVGQQPECGRVRLGETEAGEANDLRKMCSADRL